MSSATQGAELTYCTNIHPGETLEEVRTLLATHVCAVRDAFAPGARFGVGLRLSSQAAHALSQGDALESFASFLDERGLYVFTINGFPFGGFHGQRVKERVYAPDWRSEARRSYSRELATVLARLLPSEPGLYGSVSTVPVGFGPDYTGAAARVQAAHVLIAHAAELVELERSTGKRVVLALEPEPFCAIERTSEAVHYFQEHLFSRAAVAEFCALTGLARAEGERTLRRHLGLCFDACHAAVVFDDPVEGVAALEAAGIDIAKLQVSSGLEARLGPGREHVLAELERFAEGVYLHQVVERSREGTRRYLDLPEALSAARDDPQVERTWRIHFHVPVFARALGSFQGTQDSLRALLARQRARPFTGHVEVETYTWDVLPPEHQREAVTDAIVRELRWTQEELAS